MEFVNIVLFGLGGCINCFGVFIVEISCKGKNFVFLIYVIKGISNLLGWLVVYKFGLI